MHDMSMQIFCFYSEGTSPRYRGRSQASRAFPLSPRQATLRYITLLFGFSVSAEEKRRFAVLPSLTQGVIQRVACRSPGSFPKLSHAIQSTLRFSVGSNVECESFGIIDIWYSCFFTRGLPATMMNRQPDCIIRRRQPLYYTISRG